MSIKTDYYFTPCGIADAYCALQEPDYGNPERNFGNSRGIYKVNLTIPSAQARPLIDKVMKAHKANYKALITEFKKSPPAVQPGKKPLAPYEGNMPYFVNDNGTVTFKFVRYASNIDPRTQAVWAVALKVVDANGKRITNVPAIAGGSELKVRFSMFSYGWSLVAGSSVKLLLDSVMLIKLVEPDSDDGDDGWGNEVVEGGYETAEFRREAMVKALPRFVPDCVREVLIDRRQPFSSAFSTYRGDSNE